MPGSRYVWMEWRSPSLNEKIEILKLDTFWNLCFSSPRTSNRTREPVLPFLILSLCLPLIAETVFALLSVIILIYWWTIVIDRWIYSCVFNIVLGLNLIRMQGVFYIVHQFIYPSRLIELLARVVKMTSLHHIFKTIGMILWKILRMETKLKYTRKDMRNGQIWQTRY